MYYEKKIYYLWKIFNGTTETQIFKSQHSARVMSFVNGSWQGQMIYHFMPQELKDYYALTSLYLHYHNDNNIPCSDEEYKKYFDKYRDKIDNYVEKFVNDYPKFFNPIFRTQPNIDFLFKKFIILKQDQGSNVTDIMLQNEMLYTDMVQISEYEDVIIEEIEKDITKHNEDFAKANEVVKTNRLQIAQAEDETELNNLHANLEQNQRKLVETLKKYNATLLANIKKLEEHSYVLLELYNKSQPASKSERFKFKIKKPWQKMVD
ncbi:hypothetical protein UREOM_0260 [Ureaplasma sp. OM1]|uniref:Uncharacterized protein n=2 Tax=Ureaplasma ceti TaxID=3119530 RepID=A0ABP9U5J5_9BACT